MTQQRRQRKRQQQQQQMGREAQTMGRGLGARGGNEDGTGEVERRGGERCAPATVGAGKGGEEVRANDGWAPNSKSEEVCTVGARTRGIEY